MKFRSFLAGLLIAGVLVTPAFSAEQKVKADLNIDGSIKINNTVVLDKNRAATVSALVSTGNISGSGSGITNLNASNLGSGTVPDARLSTNVPLKNTSNTFSEANTFSSSVTVNGTLNARTSVTHNTQAPANRGYWSNTANDTNTWYKIASFTCTPGTWQGITFRGYMYLPDTNWGDNNTWEAIHHFTGNIRFYDSAGTLLDAAQLRLNNNFPAELLRLVKVADASWELQIKGYQANKAVGWFIEPLVSMSNVTITYFNRASAGTPITTASNPSGIPTYVGHIYANSVYAAGATRIDTSGNIIGNSLSTGDESFTYDEGTFTATLNYCTTAPTASISFTRVGKQVALKLPAALTATSNATSLTISGLPAALQPDSNRTVNIPVPVTDNDATSLGVAIISPGSSNIVFGKSLTSSGGFTASGTKGIPYLQITYNLN